MSTHPLVQETRAALASARRGRTRSVIADGAGVGRHWLEKFEQGVITNPTIGRLEKLRAYLAQVNGQSDAAGPEQAARQGSPGAAKPAKAA